MFSRISDHIYTWENIVIGSGYDAVSFAHANNYYFIFNEIMPPFPWEEIKAKPPISMLDEFDRMVIELNMNALTPLSNKSLEKITIQDDLIKIPVGSGKLVRTKYEKLHIFNTHNVDGLPPPIGDLPARKNVVVDWVMVKTGCIHRFDIFNSKDDFIKTIRFFPSARINITRITDTGEEQAYKDLVAVSYLTDDELEDPDYSEVIARFKIKKRMTRSGICGIKNGFSRGGKQLYKAVELEVDERVVRKPETKKYKNTEKIIFHVK